MAITSQNTFDTHTGNGSQVTFPFTFQITDPSEVKVLVDDAAVLSGLVVAVAADGTGDVTFTEPPASGAVITLASDPVFVNNTAYSDAGGFFPSSLNRKFDQDVVRDLHLRDGLRRALQVPQGETAPELGSFAEAGDGDVIGRINGEFVPVPNTSVAVAQDVATAQEASQAAQAAAVAVSSDAASVSADRVAAETARNGAEVAAATSGYYPDSQSAVPADVADGGYYWTDNGAPAVSGFVLYQNVSGAATPTNVRAASLEQVNDVTRALSTKIDSPIIAQSARLHHENGASLSSGVNGMLYLPGSTGSNGNLFQTGPFFNVEGQGMISIFWDCPVLRYNGINAQPAIVGTQAIGGNFNRQINIGYVPRGANNAQSGRFFIELIDDNTSRRWRCNSPVLPDGASGNVHIVMLAVVGGARCDITDLDSGITYQGDVVARPTGFTGVTQLRRNLAFGGTAEDDFPTFDTRFGQQLNTAAAGSFSDFIMADNAVSAADILAIQNGADVETIIGAANLRLYVPFVENGQLSTRTVSNQNGVGALAQHGEIFIGSALRSQRAGDASIRPMRKPVFIARENGADASHTVHKFAVENVDVLEVQIVSNSGTVLTNWFTPTQRQDNGIIEIDVTHPKTDDVQTLNVRSVSVPNLVCTVHNIWVGAAIVNHGQSESVFTHGVFTRNRTNGPAPLNIALRHDLSKVMFLVFWNTGNDPLLLNGNILSRHLPSEYAAIAQEYLDHSNEPLLIVLNAISGSAPFDLLDDSRPTPEEGNDRPPRKWSDYLRLLSYIHNTGSNGEDHAITAHTVHWDAAANFTDWDVRFVEPFYFGETNDNFIAVDHFLNDGTTSRNAAQGILPANRALGGPQSDSDLDRTIADIRTAQYRAAPRIGAKIGPESLSHRMQNNALAGTHPEPSTVDGSLEMGRGFGQHYANLLGLGDYQGPNFFVDAQFTDGSNTAFWAYTDINYPASLGTKDPDSNVISGFEVKLNGAGGFSINNYNRATTEVISALKVLVRLPSAGVAGQTQFVHQCGSPGYYDPAIITQDEVRGGALTINGKYGLAGSNTPITVRAHDD